MSFRLIGEVLLSGVPPMLALWLFVRESAPDRLQALGQVHNEWGPVVTGAVLALTYLVGATAYALCRIVRRHRQMVHVHRPSEAQPERRLLGWLRGRHWRYADLEIQRELFYVLQNGTSALVESVMYGSGLVFVLKAASPMAVIFPALVLWCFHPLGSLGPLSWAMVAAGCVVSTGAYVVLYLRFADDQSDRIHDAYHFLCEGNASDASR